MKVQFAYSVGLAKSMGFRITTTKQIMESNHHKLHTNHNKMMWPKSTTTDKPGSSQAPVQYITGPELDLTMHGGLYNHLKYGKSSANSS